MKRLGLRTKGEDRQRQPDTTPINFLNLKCRGELNYACRGFFIGPGRREIGSIKRLRLVPNNGRRLTAQFDRYPIASAASTREPKSGVEKSHGRQGTGPGARPGAKEQQMEKQTAPELIRSGRASVSEVPRAKGGTIRTLHHDKVASRSN